MSKVKVSEIIDLLQDSDCYGADEYLRAEMRKQIIEHGIQLPYVPMTDEQLDDAYLRQDNAYRVDRLRDIEQAVLNRLGVAHMPPLHADIQALIEYMDSDPLQEKNALITQREWQLLKSALGVAPTFINQVHIESTQSDYQQTQPTLDQARAICKANGYFVLMCTPDTDEEHLNRAKAICEQNGLVVVPVELVDKIDIALRAQSLSLAVFGKSAESIEVMDMVYLLEESKEVK
jgi:hypothetical protein